MFEITHDLDSVLVKVVESEVDEVTSATSGMPTLTSTVSPTEIEASWVTVCDEEKLVPVTWDTVAMPVVSFTPVDRVCVEVVHSGSPSMAMSPASMAQIDAGLSGYWSDGQRFDTSSAVNWVRTSESLVTILRLWSPQLSLAWETSLSQPGTGWNDEQRVPPM